MAWELDWGIGKISSTSDVPGPQPPPCRKTPVGGSHTSFKLGARSPFRQPQQFTQYIHPRLGSRPRRHEGDCQSAEGCHLRVFEVVSASHLTYVTLHIVDYRSGASHKYSCWIGFEYSKFNIDMRTDMRNLCRYVSSAALYFLVHFHKSVKMPRPKTSFVNVTALCCIRPFMIGKNRN